MPFTNLRITSLKISPGSLQIIQVIYILTKVEKLLHSLHESPFYAPSEAMKVLPKEERKRHLLNKAQKYQDN